MKGWASSPICKFYACCGWPLRVSSFILIADNMKLLPSPLIWYYWSSIVYELTLFMNSWALIMFTWLAIFIFTLICDWLLVCRLSCDWLFFFSHVSLYNASTATIKLSCFSWDLEREKKMNVNEQRYVIYGNLPLILFIIAGYLPQVLLLTSNIVICF